MIISKTPLLYLYLFPVAVGILLVLARIRNHKRKKQLSQSRKKSVKNSVNRNDEDRFTGDVTFLPHTSPIYFSDSMQFPISLHMLTMVLTGPLERTV